MTIQLLLALVGISASACQPSEQASTHADKSAMLRADLVVADRGSVQAQVASAQLKAAKAGRRLVVYVGATWCEPCEHFLEALKIGTLPAHLGDLRFLKFDHDEDQRRLDEAGYGGEMLPRFVLPAADGSATKNRFEGSTKGPEAMSNILPRLEDLFASP